MGLFGSAMNNLNGISNSLNTINANVTRSQIESNTRNAGNTLAQIQANQELELARKNGDLEAERLALLKQQNLKRQEKVNNTVDFFQSIIALISLIPGLIFIGLIISIFLS